MDQLHADMSKLASSVPASDWNRRAAVHFEPGADAYPSGCGDVLGRLTGHYEEHVPHVHDVVRVWRDG